MKKNAPEHNMQKAAFDIIITLEHRYPELASIYAIPNGAKLPWSKNKSTGVRYSKEAEYLLAEGMRSGIPDICCPYSNGKYSALYIENKIKPNHPTPEQEKKILLLKSLGNMCVVCYSCWEIIDAIYNYTYTRYSRFGGPVANFVNDFSGIINNL